MNESPFDMKETVCDSGIVPLIDNEMEKIISAILNNLCDYSVQGALQVLDLAKRVVLECTQLHEEY